MVTDKELDVAAAIWLLLSKYIQQNLNGDGNPTMKVSYPMLVYVCMRVQGNDEFFFVFESLFHMLHGIQAAIWRMLVIQWT